MRILLDTNVISELSRKSANPNVLNRLEEKDPDSLFLSAITIGELVYGASRLSAGVKKRALLKWLEDIEESFGDRILPVDLETCRIWGEISAISESNGRPMQTEDALIAATATRHTMHLMTRNTKDFVNTGVLLINPWEE